MDLSAFDLKGKVALITGGAHGIGFSIAVGMASCGATVCFNCSNEGSLEKGLAAYKEAGVDAHGYVADVTDEAAVNAMVAKIKEEVGPVDILVNNAGLMKRVPMIEMSHTDFLRVIDVHVGGAFNCSKAVLPDMIAKREGKIINICSMMSELGRETVSAYAAAKGALKMLTTQHRLRVRRVQHPVQRHGPRLHCHRPDRSPARDPARWQPPPVRHVHLRQDPRRPLGRPGGHGGPLRLPGLPCFGLRQWPDPLRRWRHPGLHRQAAQVKISE